MRSSLVLFDASPYCYDSAGYLAHLAVELLMKALLLELTGSFPREHSVRRLGKRLETLGATFHPNAGRILELLDEFNELRYPRPAPEVEIGDDDRDPMCKCTIRSGPPCRSTSALRRRRVVSSRKEQEC